MYVIVSVQLYNDAEEGRQKTSTSSQKASWIVKFLFWLGLSA